MKIKVVVWDKDYGKFRNETITEDELIELAKRKIMAYSNVDEEDLVDFEIFSIEF